MMSLHGFVSAGRSLAVVAAALLVSGSARAQEGEWRHATALTGQPRYPADFKHFDYVNRDAPKGGLARFGDEGGFDTFNPILPRGNVAPGLAYLTDSLTKPALDELDISASYGLLAEAMRFPPDFSSVTFRLRAEARWNDGVPVTPEDVVWSFDKTVALNPNQRFYYADVDHAEITGEREVTFVFKTKGNRELPNIMGQLDILPKHWWEGTDAEGRKRDITQTTLEPPLGSGPYRIKSFDAGRSVTYERVPDYWGKDLPVNVGYNNFDQLRFDEYRDTTVLLEAFKGDQYDFRSENSAKNWVTGYEFPARDKGKVILEKFPDRATGIMQAFVMNLRLPKFQDPRVRRALNLAFNFEALSDSIFFGEYKRIDSFFAGTELASSGLPAGKELEVLDSVRDKVPADLFTKPYSNPVSATPEQERANLRQAVQLLQEAGLQMKGRTVVDPKTGQPFTIELIDNDPSVERYFLPFQQNLAKIGITATLRVLDSSQYIQRLRNRDFEMTVTGWAQSLSPGNEQKFMWGSAAADLPNSQNYAGIRNTAVDAIIDRILYSTTREDLVAATHALDRVLLWNDYVIPEFYSGTFRIARWDRFGHPPNIPPYTVGFPDIWWWDADKAKAVATP